MLTIVYDWRFCFLVMSPTPRNGSKFLSCLCWKHYRTNLNAWYTAQKLIYVMILTYAHVNKKKIIF